MKYEMFFVLIGFLLVVPIGFAQDWDSYFSIEHDYFLTYYDNGTRTFSWTLVAQYRNATFTNQNLVLLPPTYDSVNIPADKCEYVNQNGKSTPVFPIHAYVLETLGGNQFGNFYVYVPQENITYNTNSLGGFQVTFNCLWTGFNNTGIVNITVGGFLPTPDKSVLTIKIPRQNTFFGILSQFDRLDWQNLDGGTFNRDDTDKNFYIEKMNIDNPRKSADILVRYTLWFDWTPIEYDFLFLIVSVEVLDSILHYFGKNVFLTRLIFRKDKRNSKIRKHQKKR